MQMVTTSIDYSYNERDILCERKAAMAVEEGRTTWSSPARLWHSPTCLQVAKLPKVIFNLFSLRPLGVCQTSAFRIFRQLISYLTVTLDIPHIGWRRKLLITSIK